MHSSHEQSTVRQGDTLLYVEGGDVRVGQVLSVGSRKLRIREGDGDERKVEHSRFAVVATPGGGEELAAAAHKLADSVGMATIWRIACGEILSTAGLAQRCFPTVSSPARELALHLANAREGGYFQVCEDQWRPASKEHFAAVSLGRTRRASQRLVEKNWRDAIATGQQPTELEQYLDAYVDGSADTNDPRHRFLQQYGRERGLSLGAVAVGWGRVQNLEHYHLHRLRADLPGTLADAGPASYDLAGLPTHATDAFAVDAEGTIEVDDAFSVMRNGDLATVGIHIAAPCLSMPAAARTQAQARMATVYLPGAKYLMLPSATMASYSLTAGATRPCVSLLLVWNCTRQQIVRHSFALGKISIGRNLAIENLIGRHGLPTGLPQELSADFATLQAVASTVQQKLVAGHLVKLQDGMPEILQRCEFQAADRMVAAMMVLYNQLAAKFMQRQNTAYLSRSEGRLRISCGDGEYGWFTSPLRRLADLYNQELLYAILTQSARPHGRGKLWKFTQTFNKRYARILQQQQRMDTYWSLRWLAGKLGEPLRGRTLGEPGKVRLTIAPITVQVPTCTEPADVAVVVKLAVIDEFALTAQGVLA